MADTPHMLRGEFYPTHKVARCTRFKKCPVCSMCEHYNRYASDCIFCETRKRPIQTCRCTPSNRAAGIKVLRRLGKNIFDPSNRGEFTSVDVSKMDDWDTMVEDMGIRSQEYKN